MPLPIIRYTLDPTGLNPDNRVVGEIHNLSSRDIRAAAPIYGAYFTDSLRVYDNSTDKLLARGTDYQCVELLQDASLSYGKEICLLVLILNKQISNQIRINYQVLGGGFQNPADNIINLYENVIKDERPVDWVNVLNKPLEYPPSLHQHLINDVVGFQSLIHSIERVRNAIILSDVPAYEALLDHVYEQNQELRDYITNTVTEQVINHVASNDNPHLVTAEQIGLGAVENLGVVTIEDVQSGEPVRKYVTYDMLLYILALYIDNANYRVIPNLLNLKEGHTVNVIVETNNVENGTKLYWTIQHLTTDDDDFSTTAGVVTINNDLAYFSVSLLIDEISDPNETFRILLRKDSPTGIVVASTGVITVEDVPEPPVDDSVLNLTAENIFDPRIIITPASLFLTNSNHPLITTRKLKLGGSRSFNHDIYTLIKLDSNIISPGFELTAETMFYNNKVIRANRTPDYLVKLGNTNITSPGYTRPTTI